MPDYLHVLPSANRLRRPTDFSSVVRRGTRVGGPRLVVHHRFTATSAPDLDLGHDSPRVGFIVSRAVGGSVVRHRVTRRLRAQVTQRLEQLRPGSAMVVRALPAAANATSAQFGADLDRALTRIAGPA